MIDYAFIAQCSRCEFWDLGAFSHLLRQPYTGAICGACSRGYSVNHF